MRTAGSPIRLTALAALLAVAAAMPATAGAHLPGGAHYVGETEDGHDVGVRLSDRGRHIARLRIVYDLRCDSGARGTSSTTVFDVRIRSEGRFAYRGSYRGREDGASNRVTLRGRVTKRLARGTFELTATGRPEGSEEKVRCATGRVSWRAERVR